MHASGVGSRLAFCAGETLLGTRLMTADLLDKRFQRQGVERSHAAQAHIRIRVPDHDTCTADQWAEFSERKELKLSVHTVPRMFMGKQVRCMHAK